MRLAIAVLFINIVIILMTTFYGIGFVMNGPLNTSRFFVDDVRYEFTDWSRSLAKHGNKTYVDKKSCPKDLQQFMEKFGVIFVAVSSNGDMVDWLLDGRFRVRVHYSCSFPKDGSDGDDCSWAFSLEGESVSAEALLDILAVRRQKCKKWTMIFCLLLCVVLISNKFYFLDHIWQKMPVLWRVLIISIIWTINVLLLGVVIMNLFINTCERRRTVLGMTASCLRLESVGPSKPL